VYPTLQLSHTTKVQNDSKAERYFDKAYSKIVEHSCNHDQHSYCEKRSAEQIFKSAVLTATIF
jgi:hypothetical protein